MPSFMFNQEDLDMILYGYAKNKVNEALPGHALSGLRIGNFVLHVMIGDGSIPLCNVIISYFLAVISVSKGSA